MHIFFLSEGFGFNTDVLETNILNLAVVLAIVVVYVGDAFSAMLDARRDRIVKSVQTAEEKYAAAQDALKQAQQRLTDAQSRAATIRSEGSATVSQVTALVASQANEELARLEDLRQQLLHLLSKKLQNSFKQNLCNLH